MAPMPWRIQTPARGTRDQMVEPVPGTSGTRALRPRARILRTFGDELISSETVAVTELVKNAYDADATRVLVRFQEPLEIGQGRIEVIDNGHGMSLETIQTAWMEPATLMRKRQRRSEERGRRVLGEKGIGRFAASRLADRLEVVTRRAGMDRQVQVFFDWRQFDDEQKYLDQVQALWEEVEPAEICPGGTIQTLWEEEEERRVRTPLIVFNLALVLLAVSIVGLLLSRGVVQDADFPEALQRAVARFASLVTSWSGWVAPAVGIVALIVMLAAIVLASGRSAADLLKGILRGDVSREALQLAIGYLDSGEWREAITQLTRIDLLEVKDPVRRKEVLFCLAYAHHRAEHPAEARQYVTELLGEDPRHQEGLYLAGYMALKDGQLEEAERAWRALNQLAPRFSPPGGSPQQSAAYYLGLTLYRRAMQAIDKDLEAGARLLAEVSEIRALDREVADALIRVHLYRTASLIRQRELDRAAYELRLAKDKLQHLKELVGDKDEVAKLTGLCQAALGLVALKREQYSEAQTSFGQAIKDTKDLVPKQELFAVTGQSFLEQLLRLAFQEMDQDATGKINRTFSRDLHFLTSVAVLHSLQDTLSESPKDRVSRQLVSETLTSDVQPNLERSLDIHPDFVEARALLGLLYYYLGPDKAKREKGIEILQTVRKRVGSRFVSETVAEYEEQQKRKAEARGAYFDLLQQYLRSASVPIKEREDLRQQVLDEMKATGEYEDFVGHGGLEIDTEREREPTVREYAARAALLAEKLEELKRLDREGRLPPEVERLMQQLKKQNQGLEEQLKSIATVERELLLKAQQLL